MRKIKFFSLLFLTIMLFVGGTAYAYFIKEIVGDTHSISSSPDDTAIIEVSTLEEFSEAVRQEDEFNSSSLVSNASQRKTIKLLSDIRLTATMLINADCHINLNGKVIDLRGYNIVFKHQFAGVFAVYGGYIDDTTGQTDVLDNEEQEELQFGSIIIDCPNAVVDFDEESLLLNSEIIVDYVSDNQVVNSAMKFIFSNIQNIGINDFYSVVNDFTFSSNEQCQFDHNEGTACIYTYTDLDLIDNYFSYEGLSINYESSDNSILSDSGKITVPNQTETVDLTITVTYEEVVLTKVVSVHVLSEADYLDASNLVILKHLEKYYDEDSEKLLFENSFLLPKSNFYFNTEYSYILTTDDPSYQIESNKESDYFDISTYDDYYVVSLSKDIKGIVVKSISSFGSVSSDSVPLSGESTTLVDDNNSYAVNIVRELYGNQLFIRNEQPTYSTYSEYDLLIDPTINGYSRIENISYQLINNSEGTYEILDYPEFDLEGQPVQNYGKYQYLRVDKNSNVKPYISQSVFLAITFKFTGDYEGQIVVQIPVIFEPVDLGGNGFSAFDPYYVYFDKNFSLQTSNYSYESFSIPFTFDGNDPVYTFIVFEETSEGFVRLEEGGLFTFSLSNDSTYLHYSKDTLMNVTINPYYINFVDTKYYFAYVPTYTDSLGNVYYCYQSSEGAIAYDLSEIEIDLDYYEYVSELVIPGIVRYKNTKSLDGIDEAFADKELYEIAYDMLNDDVYEDGKFILSSSLESQISIVDFSSADTSLLKSYEYSISLSSSDRDNYIDSFKGIEYLIGINSLTFEGTNLANSGLFANEFQYISKIQYLRVLNLNNTGIYDQQSNTLGFPTGTSNNFLDTLSSLKNLEEIYLCDNAIYNFNALNNYASLKKVDVRNNKFSANLGIAFLSNMITNLVNSLYGSGGVTNLSTFLTLESKGVEVLYDKNESDTLDSNLQDVIAALSSLQYQDRLSKNIDIVTVLNSLYPSGSGSDVCSAYNINPNFTITGESEAVFTFDSLSFEETSVGFKLKIKYNWEAGSWPFNESGEVTFEYEYRVERY